MRINDQLEHKTLAAAVSTIRDIRRDEVSEPSNTYQDRCRLIDIVSELRVLEVILSKETTYPINVKIPNFVVETIKEALDTLVDMESDTIAHNDFVDDDARTSSIARLTVSTRLMERLSNNG